MRETATASFEFVSLSRQARSKKIKFTVSGNLRKVHPNPSVQGLSREVTARRPAKNKNAVALGRRGGKAKSQTYPRRAEGDNGEGARKRLAFKDSHPQEAMPISGMQNY
jgi:hypothetical protein